MVGGKIRSEKEYRELPIDSYSSVATFAKNRLSYYFQYVKGEKEEEEDDKAILTGNLTEALLSGMEKEFDRKFYLSTCPETPTENMLNFVNALYRHTELNAENGVVSVEFEELARRAYEESGYKIKLEAVLKKFTGSNAESYYRQLRATKPKGLQIVTQKDLENAQKIAEELKTNSITSWYVNLVSDDRFIVINQFQFDDLEIEGIPLKGMLDKLIIDTLEKVIYIIDWKVTWAVESFIREYYLKRFTYLQAIIYYLGILYTKQDLGINMAEYTILPPKFVVSDSAAYSEPLIYELTSSDLNDAFNGFTMNGRYYPGLQEILGDLKWAKDNNKFRISKRNFLNGGICHIHDQRK